MTSLLISFPPPGHGTMDLSDDSPKPPLRATRGPLNGSCALGDPSLLSSCYSDSSFGDDFASEQDDNNNWGEAQAFLLDEALHRMRRNLVLLSYPEARAWEDRASYAAPKQLSRSSKRQSHSLYVENEEDASDSEVVVISRPMGTFHLACPFYAGDPKRHKSCILEDDLRSIEDVTQHLGQRHLKPPYCPICYNTFGSYIDRDDHILEMTCKIRDNVVIDGIAKRDNVKLLRQDEVHLSTTERWHHIWDFLFPGKTMRPSPHLETGHGLALSKLRDYWRIYGLAVVLDYMSSQPEQFSDPSTVQDVMWRLVLDGLLRKRVEEH